MMSWNIFGVFFVSFKLTGLQHETQLDILRDFAGCVIGAESKIFFALNDFLLQPYIPLIQDFPVLRQQARLDQRHFARFLRQVDDLTFDNHALTFFRLFAFRY